MKSRLKVFQRQNKRHLLKAMGRSLNKLRVKNKEAEQRLSEIKRLNDGLQASNQEITVLLEERQKFNKRLISINQELDRFAHIVSHDLKAPLFNIFSLTAIIAEALQENNLEEIKTTNHMIRDQVARMEKFIDDVLLYSTAGRFSLPKSQVEVDDLLDELVKVLIIPRHIRICRASAMPTLFTERVYLEQIFSNLISNALKYNDKPEGMIEIGCSLKADLLQFWVADNGPGIPLAEQEAIFRPYETSSLHRNTSTGLGLSIIEKIIKLKGAAIWVDSKGAQGSRFTFTWPVAELLIRPQDNQA